MKTICESCCDSPATLVACGREGTVLCGTCDTPSAQGERVAFVAGPETRVACDICQSSPAVSLCHEDRAFLCRACDASIHSANEHAAAHSRFLFTNVKLELEAVGASKKRKVAEMNDRDERPRVSVSGDFAVPSFGYHQLEQRVPETRRDVSDAYDVSATARYPLASVADGPNTDPFAAEFLHLDGGDGKAKNKNGHSGVLDDSEYFVSAFFDDAGADADAFGVVPVF